MDEVMPVDAQSLGALSKLAERTAVLLDGYRDSSVPIALARTANLLVCANPHLRPGCSGPTGLLSYVQPQMRLAMVDSSTLFVNSVGTQLYEIFYGMHFGLVVVDLDPDEHNAYEHLSVALELHSHVAVIDRTSSFAHDPLQALLNQQDPWSVESTGMLHVASRPYLPRRRRTVA